MMCEVLDFQQAKASCQAQSGETLDNTRNLSQVVSSLWVTEAINTAEAEIVRCVDAAITLLHTAEESGRKLESLNAPDASRILLHLDRSAERASLAIQSLVDEEPEPPRSA